MVDLELFDDLSEVEDTSDNVEEVVYKALSEETIIPKNGNFLGLDISQNSSGICFYKNGEKFLYNSFAIYEFGNPHAEAFLRFQLKQDLLEVIGDEELDLVVIEDVFEGNNPDVVRRLYALNTAIDDLILEGKVVCKEFVRVPNGTWKSWLSVVDTDNVYKGYKDKEKVQGYLKILGVEDSGEGFQDRLDATGMLLGYFLQGRNTTEPEKVKKRKKLNISIDEVVCAYEVDQDFILASARYDVEDVKIVMIGDTRISKNKILNYLSDDIESIYITNEPIRLGLLADTLGLELLEEDKGYFGFWLSPKAKKKYLKKLAKG